MPWLDEITYTDSPNALRKERRKELPLITIVIPVYNGSNYVGRAIKSAIAQREHYSAIEVFVVNDGSTDNGATQRIVQEFGSAVRYVEKQNGGVASALNLAIQEMKGEYFSWLSHDDFFATNRFAVLKPYLFSLAENTILSHDTILVDESEKVIRADHSLSEKIHSFPYFNLTGCFFSGCALLIPKRLLSSAGPFRENLACTQDMEMWARLSHFACVVHIKMCLTSITVHEHQGSVTQRAKLATERSLLFAEIVKRYLHDEHSWHHACSLLHWRTPRLLAVYLFQYYSSIRNSPLAANQVVASYNKSFNSCLTRTEKSIFLGKIFSILYFLSRALIIGKIAGPKGLWRSACMWLQRNFH